VVAHSFFSRNLWKRAWRNLCRKRTDPVYKKNRTNMPFILPCLWGNVKFDHSFNWVPFWKRAWRNLLLLSMLAREINCWQSAHHQDQVTADAAKDNNSRVATSKRGMYRRGEESEDTAVSYTPATRDFRVRQSLDSYWLLSCNRTCHASVHMHRKNTRRLRRSVALAGFMGS
jgi:hypothetical protein